MPQPHHILIVDDDEQMRLVLTRLLKRTWTDATIAEAAHGAEALSLIAQQRPDLIISDYQMPVIDGLTLVRTLRAQVATMPILVLSSEPSLGKSILAAGADAFLTKPLTLGTFTQILRTLLPDDEETRALGQ
jgi:CheY-like chemotaxis protein